MLEYSQLTICDSFSGQQRDSSIHTHVSILPRFPSHPGCSATLSRIPLCCTVGSCWLFILVIARCTWLDVDHFSSLYWMCYNITFCSFMFWCFGHKACGILAPWSEVRPEPPALQGEVLTPGPSGKLPSHVILTYQFTWPLLAVTVKWILRNINN